MEGLLPLEGLEEDQGICVGCVNLCCLVLFSRPWLIIDHYVAHRYVRCQSYRSRYNIHVYKYMNVD